MHGYARAGAVLCGLAVLIGAWTAGAANPEWKTLFDGTDLKCWQNARGGPPHAGWQVTDKALSVAKDAGAGYIWTKERFGDFVLDLEFVTTGNSGIFFRTDRPSDPVQTGIELQIDRTGGPGNKNGLGALYDLLPPTQSVTGTGDWHRVTLTCEDNRIRVKLDGAEVIDADLNQWTEPHKNPDGTRNKFRQPLKDFTRDGHIGLQDHGAAVQYRNIRVKRLAGQK